MSDRPVVRSMRVEDLEQVVDLHVASFGHRDNSLDDVKAFYQRVFLRCLDATCTGREDSPSLVAERDGVVVGMVLGATLHARLNGQPVVGTTASLLATRRGHTSPWLSRRLIETMCSRSGDLLYSDRSNSSGRRVGEASGMTGYPPYSLRWAIVLAPGKAAAAGVLNRRSNSGRVVAGLIRQAGSLADRTLHRRLQKYQHHGVVKRPLDAQPLSPSDLVAHSPRVLDGYTLTPDLSSAEMITESWRWLDLLRTEGRHDRVGVWDSRGHLVGWFLLHTWPTGVAEVVQLASTRAHADRVIAVVISEARRLGIASLHGSVPPALLLPLGEAGAYFHMRGSTVGIFSPYAEMHAAFANGTAYLTGLEGEYPLHLAPSASRSRARPSRR